MPMAALTVGVTVPLRTTSTWRPSRYTPYPGQATLFGRHALAADVDLERGAGVRERPRHVGHADGRMDGGGNGAAAPHVHRAPVEIPPVPGTGHALRLAPAEPEEPALHALQPLPLQ